MEPVKKNFLKRLHSVQAELRELVQLLPELDQTDNNWSRTILSDVTFSQVYAPTIHVNFRLKPGHEPNWKEIKVRFTSREVENNDSDIDNNDSGDY